MARVVTIGMDQVLRARRSTTVLRSVLRSVLISGLPLAAFVLWYVSIRDETRSTTALGGSASFGIRVLTNGVAGFFGLGTRWSTPVGVLFTGALMAIVVIRWRHIDHYRLGALIVGIIIDVVVPLTATTWFIIPRAGTAGTAGTTSTLAVRARQRGSAYASWLIVSLATSATGSVKGVFADRSATANARPWILRIEPTIPTDLCADD